MSNTDTAVRDNRELTLYLGTYWFDFEQAAELGNEALTNRSETQPDKLTEEHPADYVI
jgi:hypothetical protein